MLYIASLFREAAMAKSAVERVQQRWFGDSEAFAQLFLGGRADADHVEDTQRASLDNLFDEFVKQQQRTVCTSPY